MLSKSSRVDDLLELLLVTDRLAVVIGEAAIAESRGSTRSMTGLPSVREKQPGHSRMKCRVDEM